jgi:DNA-binding protein
VLSYEKECLIRVFTTMTNGVQNVDIKHCMEKIYGAYVDVVQCWREKLQLEYDLEDLECEYKRERMGNEENILIELRKEIETFRKELHHQKECLCN